MKSFTLYRPSQLRIPVIHSFVADIISSLEDISARVEEYPHHHQIIVVYGFMQINFLLLEPTVFNQKYTLVNQNTGALIHSSSSLFKTLLHLVQNLQVNY